MTIKNQAGLAELDLARPNIPQGTIPVALLFERTLYRLASWQELVKIFCYLAHKTAGGEEFFAAHVDRFFYFANGTVSLADAVGAKKKIVFCDYKQSYDSDIKFASDCYIRIEWLSPEEIVAVLHYVAQDLGLDGIGVFLGEQQADHKARLDKLLKGLNKNRKKNKYADKNAKYFIARINNETLLPQEKFYKRIEREFDRKVLIGDISISEKEEGLLKNYMRVRLRSLNECGDIGNDYPKVFAYGLVRFAMKYYSQKTFFPHFKEEYGVEVKLNAQGALHDVFRRIMTDSKKAYDKDLAMKIDNISMHCFVTDRCAGQLFDYLFDFWRLDLKRNIENIYGPVGKKYFNLLLTEIESRPADVMKHTSMALKLQKQSCRLRLRRILELMDDCFWNRSEIPQTGNRINELLRKWMQDPNGKFQKEQKIAIASHRGARGETLLSCPILCADFQTATFSLRLPREILKEYSAEQAIPVWEIKIGESTFTVPTMPCEGKIGFYTEECEFKVPADQIFLQMKISLDCVRKVYTVKEDCYRFFSEKGVRLDHKKNLPCGPLVLYSETEEIPQKLYGEKTTAEPFGKLFVARYQADEGDILLFPDQKAVQAGQQIREGLIGAPLRGVVSEADGGDAAVYSLLPKLLFRAKREQLAGAALLVENDLGQSEPMRIEGSYFEFKLDEKLDDVYGYLIDLKEYFKEDGFYRFRLSLPASSAIDSYRFAYLKNLQFEFEGKPYLFTNAGKISFPERTEIETDGEWEIGGGKKTLSFVFDTESRDCSRYVRERDLCLDYHLRDRKIALKFRIPSFYWKYQKEEHWRVQPPADLPIRKIPAELYVCGPFDFRTGKISVDHRSQTFFDETEISAQRAGEDYAFHLSGLKSFLDHSVVKRTVSLTLDGVKRPLLNIICRSYVLNASIVPDYENGTLIGRFEILGDAEYCAKVERDGKIIGQDLPVSDGTFALETDTLGGDYLITLYEIFEDESGFDAELVELGNYALTLTDVTKLQDRSAEIVSVQDREKRYAPLMLSQRHIIGDLQYLGRYKDVCDLEVYGLWHMDFNDEEQMKNCFFYRGELALGEKGRRAVCSVMMIFPDRLDLTKCVILRKDGEEYLEPLYDYKTHSLVATDAGMSKLQKRERIAALDDDKYEFSVKIRK